jgi:uncharacterized damage-inducible protein DinB
MKMSLWVQRQFQLGVPVSLYPNLIERVRGTSIRIEERVRGLTREVLTHRESNSWSIQEHVGHLLDLGTLDLGRLDDFEAGVEVIRAADMANRKTYEAHHNDKNIESILHAFKEERGLFVKRLEGYDESFLSRKAVHPRLQQAMGLADLIFFISEHDDHHLAKITELRRSFGA